MGEQPPQGPSMRAPTMWERLKGFGAGAYEALANQPLMQLAGRLAQETTTQDDPNDPLGLPPVTLGMMPMGPGGGMGRGMPGRTAPIPGNTLDDILAAGEAQYPAARTMQVVESGSGRVVDPAREAALKLARQRAGR